jgi:DNA-binding XRE family transcriptional regulator
MSRSPINRARPHRNQHLPYSRYEPEILNDLAIRGALAIAEVLGSRGGTAAVFVGRPEPALNADWKTELPSTKSALLAMEGWMEEEYASPAAQVARKTHESLRVLLTIAPASSLFESMDSTSEIMTVLRAGRALLGLSQEELAGLAGVSRQIVVRIEKCETNVLVESIEKVRLALEAGGVVFIDGSPERGPGVAMTRRLRSFT